jgi:hypothetical protein
MRKKKRKESYLCCHRKYSRYVYDIGFFIVHITLFRNEGVLSFLIFPEKFQAFVCCPAGGNSPPAHPQAVVCRSFFLFSIFGQFVTHSAGIILLSHLVSPCSLRRQENETEGEKLLEFSALPT